MDPKPDANVRPGDAVPPPEARGQEAAAPASEEEQMERFEDALKEADWGHQPC